MNKSNNAPLICCIIGIVAIVITFVVSGSNNATTTESTTTYAPSYTTPKTTPSPKQEEKETWHCIDATSYNKNPYDDNKCTSNKGEVRLVPDSEARKLDPSYTPGTSGNSYYNNF